jgi:hypothetical protein
MLVMDNANFDMKTRSAERSRTRIFGTIRYFNQATQGRVVDLSETGMALELHGPFHAANGSRVRIESEELGILEGTVKWCRGGRVGVQFNLNSNALAQVSSYFRFFHQDVKPVLTR